MVLPVYSFGSYDYLRLHLVVRYLLRFGSLLSVTGHFSIDVLPCRKQNFSEPSCSIHVREERTLWQFTMLQWNVTPRVMWSSFLVCKINFIKFQMKRKLINLLTFLIIHSSVRIMLLYPIWSLSPGSWLV